MFLKTVSHEKFTNNFQTAYDICSQSAFGVKSESQHQEDLNSWKVQHLTTPTMSFINQRLILLFWLLLMISFCQDLSISYQYHVYENKTIKKITHSRNGSNLSEKTTVKSNKLSLVSKNPPLNKSAHNPKGISLTDSKRPEGLSPKNKPGHKRHFSNHVEMRVMDVSERKEPEQQPAKKEINFAQQNELASIQLHQRPFQQRVYFNHPQYLHNINPQEKPSIITQSPTMPSHSFVQSAKHLNQQPSSFKNWELHQSQTIRINGSLERLDESRETRKNNYQEKQCLAQNHSHANSLRSYETQRKVRQGKEEETETQDHKSQKRGFEISKEMIFLTPKVAHVKKVADTSHYYNFDHGQSQNLYYKIILPQTHFPTDHFYDNSKSPLFDAASIVSKTLNDQQLDDQSLSIVQQRNFFFQKQQEPNHAFKKSIQKFIFFEPGHTSENGKWVLFRNVQEKENRKIYSIKEFSAEDEREYFNEYDVYLSLKAETSHQYPGRVSKTNAQCVFLQLFNALSNNDEKKLHLVKEPFEYLLADYVSYLKKRNTLAIDRIRILVGEKSKLQSEIEKVFQFFSSKDILIRQEEYLEMGDFVVCKDLSNNHIIKFHSLSKLQKREKFQTVLPKQSLAQKLKPNKDKLEELHEKIHAVFFFE